MPRLENLPRPGSLSAAVPTTCTSPPADLDLEQARAILNLMRCHSNDCNKFFIDVRHVTRIQPAAAAPSRCASLPSRRSASHYKGSRGFELATSGNKVLIVPEKGKACLQGHLPQLPLQGQKARAKARNTVRAAVASGGAAVA